MQMERKGLFIPAHERISHGLPLSHKDNYFKLKTHNRLPFVSLDTRILSALLVPGERRGTVFRDRAISTLSAGGEARRAPRIGAERSFRSQRGGRGLSEKPARDTPSVRPARQEANRSSSFRKCDTNSTQRPGAGPQRPLFSGGAQGQDGRRGSVLR